MVIHTFWVRLGIMYARHMQFSKLALHFEFLALIKAVKYQFSNWITAEFYFFSRGGTGRLIIFLYKNEYLISIRNSLKFRILNKEICNLNNSIEFMSNI